MRRNVAKAFALDSIAGIRMIQERLRRMSEANLKASKTVSRDERLQMEGQADAYSFIADQIDELLRIRPCFEAEP